MRPRLTRRGKAVLAVAVLGLLMAWGFGGRSLNYVVVPVAALLALGGVGVARLDRPTVTRRAPEYGHVGHERTVELDVTGGGGHAVTVRDALPHGIEGESVIDTVADGRTLRYDVRLAERGVHTIGPVRIRATDLFGLWEREFYYGTTATVVAFPRVRPLAGTAELLTGYVGLTDERDEFAGVREYERGDALRDVNWKASAKRQAGELVVTEYVGHGSTDRVAVVAEAAGHRTDSVAEAAASVAAHLLDAGLDVGLVTAQGSVHPSNGDDHRRRLLGLLARLDTGQVRARHRREADVVVSAPSDGGHVRIDVGGGDHRFGELVGEEVSA